MKNTYGVVGRIGSDAEVKELQNHKLLTFSMSLDRSYYDKDKKERVDRVEWVRINKFFDKSNAVNVAPYLKKGTLVYVEGIPKAEAWIKEGEAVAGLSITGREIDILASAKVEAKTNDDMLY